MTDRYLFYCRKNLETIVYQNHYLKKMLKMRQRQTVVSIIVYNNEMACSVLSSSFQFRKFLKISLAIPEIYLQFAIIL